MCGGDITVSDGYDQPYTMAKTLELDVLMSLTPYKGSVDIATQAARDLLFNCLQMENHVHDIFFPEIVDHKFLRQVKRGTFPMHELATGMVAMVISKQKDDQKFHQMINRAATEECLRDIYESLQWKKIGFLLYTLVYPEVVRDPKSGVTLRDFMEDGGHEWAEKMVEEVKDPKWTLNYVQKIVKGRMSDEEYNRDMNSLFVKLHLLDPQSVIPAYQFLLNQKALPKVNLELATRNYLGGPFDLSGITKQVVGAIKKETTPINVSRISLTEIELFNGAEVDEFIVTECRNIGLWTGKKAENVRKSKFTDRCSIM